MMDLYVMAVIGAMAVGVYAVLLQASPKETLVYAVCYSAVMLLVGALVS